MTEALTMTSTRDIAGSEQTGLRESGADPRPLTVADYEARIALYREQIGVGYIGIGRTLNEAKAAGAVPAGQWEDWVTRVTGLTPRQAQRCMQAAREIRDGSALARLEMSKAMRLLSSGLDEDQREALAEKVSQDELTVKELEAEIRRLQAGHDQMVVQARAWEQRAREAFDNGQRAAQVEAKLSTVELDELRKKLRDAEIARKNMQAALDRVSGQRAELSGEVDRIRGELHTQEQRADAAERRMRDLQAGQTQKTAEEYYKGRNEGMREVTERANREKADLQAGLDRLQETISRQQDTIDQQLAELSELRRKDRQAKMAQMRGVPVSGSVDGVFPYSKERPISEMILLLISKCGVMDPGVYRKDASLAGELDALEQWIRRARDLIGVAVDGEVR